MHVRKLVVIGTLSVLAAACQTAANGTQFGPTPSQSPTPSATVSPRLPSFLLMTADQARGEAVGLKLSVAFQLRPTVFYIPGTVVLQNPKAGTIMRPGMVVTLTVTVAPVCDPSYPGVCIPPFRPDLKCSQIPYRNFKVIPPDDDGFDKDHNGIGCPSNHPNPPPPKHH